MILTPLQPGESTTTVGLDIGAYATKLVVCEHVQDRHRVRLAATVTNEFALNEEDGDEAVKQSGKNLAKLIQEHGLIGEEVTFCVPSDHAVLKWVALPEMPEADFQQALKAKVKRVLPMPLDEVYVASSQKSRSVNGDCLVAAVPKEKLGRLAISIESARVLPRRAETAAHAIVRVVQRLVESNRALMPSASYTIVDLGLCATHMYVVQDRQLKFHRSFKFGARQFVKRIAAQLDLKLPEAARLMEDPRAWISSSGSLYLPWGDSHAVVSMDEELVILTREFHRLVRYIRSIFPSRSFSGMLDSFLLCGGLSGLHGLPEFIGGEINVKVEHLNAFRTVDLDVPSTSFTSTSLNPGRYAAALGLALAGLSNPTNKEVGREFAWARSA